MTDNVVYGVVFGKTHAPLPDYNGPVAPAIAHYGVMQKPPPSSLVLDTSPCEFVAPDGDCA